MSSLFSLTASEIATLVRKGQVSAREVAKDGLSRIEDVNPSINAIVECDPKRVLASADLVDKMIRQRLDPGPMAGVLVTVKDSVEQAGVAMTLGLKSRAAEISSTNSPVADNLIKAGSVVLGTTNVPAFCYRWFTDNQLFGKTSNPRVSGVTPGGSSGGAGAAVAAGLGHIAHGGDIAGSIRYPAYACGVHGLRPSLGRVPSYDASANLKGIGSQLMATQGPLARSVADLELAFRAMAREDMRDPWWTPVPFRGPDLPRKIGVCIRPEGLNTNAAVVAELEGAASRLRDRGWVVEAIDVLPPLREAAVLQVRLWFGDGYDGLLAAAEKEGDPGAIAALKGQRTVIGSFGISDFSETLKRRAALVSMWQQFLNRYTAILMPVSGELPFPDAMDLQSDEDYLEVWEAQLPLIAPPLLGLPGLSLCTGNVSDVPIGIQILSNRFREDACLAVAAEIESTGYKISIADPKFRQPLRSVTSEN